MRLALVAAMGLAWVTAVDASAAPPAALETIASQPR